MKLKRLLVNFFTSAFLEKWGVLKGSLDNLGSKEFILNRSFKECRDKKCVAVGFFFSNWKSVVEKQAEEMLEVYEEQFKQPFFGLDRFF